MERSMKESTVHGVDSTDHAMDSSAHAVDSTTLRRTMWFAQGKVEKVCKSVQNPCPFQNFYMKMAEFGKKSEGENASFTRLSYYMLTC